MRRDSKNTCRRVWLKELPNDLFAHAFAPYLVRVVDRPEHMALAYAPKYGEAETAAGLFPNRSALHRSIAITS